MKTVSIASAAALVAQTSIVPSVAVGKVQPDLELVLLGDQFDDALAAWRQIHEEYEAAREALFKPALAAIPRGLPDKEFLARYQACFDDTGFGPYHDANDMGIDLLSDIGGQIRAKNAESMIGIAVKIRVLRYELEHTLNLDEWADECFSGLQGEIERLAESLS